MFLHRNNAGRGSRGKGVCVTLKDQFGSNILFMAEIERDKINLF